MLEISSQKLSHFQAKIHATLFPVLGQHVPLEVGRVGRLVAAHLADAVQYLVVDGLLVVLDEPGPAAPVVALVAGKVLDLVVLGLDVVLEVGLARRPEVAPVAGKVLYLVVDGLLVVLDVRLGGGPVVEVAR